MYGPMTPRFVPSGTFNDNCLERCEKIVNLEERKVSVDKKKGKDGC
jgi:hypothetical protein